MVGNNGTMMAIRIVHSKLRKREEHSASVHPAEVLQAAPAPPQEPLAFRQQPLWQFPPPLPPPYVYPHDQVSTQYNKRTGHSILNIEKPVLVILDLNTVSTYGTMLMQLH